MTDLQPKWARRRNVKFWNLRKRSAANKLQKIRSEIPSGLVMVEFNSHNDHQAALARINVLMDAELGTPDGEELHVLAELVEAYEDARWE